MDNQELRKELISLLTSLSYKQLLRCEYHLNIPIVVDEYLSIEKETPTIQVDAKEYNRLKGLDKREIINQFNNRHRDYSYGMVIHKQEETREEKDVLQNALLFIICVLLVFIIIKL